MNEAHLLYKRETGESPTIFISAFRVNDDEKFIKTATYFVYKFPKEQCDSDCDLELPDPKYIKWLEEKVIEQDKR